MLELAEQARVIEHGSLIDWQSGMLERLQSIGKLRGQTDNWNLWEA